jgi:phage gp36-like protein
LEDISMAMPVATLIQLTDDTDVQTAVNEDVLDDHIAKAGDVIESYLRQRYVLPITPVPPILVEVAVSLTVFGLFARRPETHDEPPKLWLERNRTALRMLEQMQAGRITLGVAGANDADPKNSEFHVNPRRREFGRRLWARYQNPDRDYPGRTYEE